MINENYAWLASGGPVKFVIGLNGLPYAVLPNEYEAEDYIKLVLKDDTRSFACCGGFFNGVLLQDTIGM